MLQSLKYSLLVDQVGDFAIPAAKSLLRAPSELNQLLRALLDPAVHREQYDPHEDEDVDGQQSFYSPCHSHETGKVIQMRGAVPMEGASRGRETDALKA